MSRALIRLLALSTYQKKFVVTVPHPYLLRAYFGSIPEPYCGVDWVGDLESQSGYIWEYVLPGSSLVESGGAIAVVVVDALNR
jgi:hypothetical protein